MLGMISYRANGDRIETVNETPAFFGLTWNGVVVEYFGTLQALQLAVESLKVEQIERISKCETTAYNLKLAA